jgi:DNA polymerase-3 subunit delta
MEISYSKLKAEDWKTPATIYLLTGEEETLKKEFVAKLRTALGIQPNSFDETILDAREAKGHQIVGAALTVPVEGEKRFVLLNAVQRLASRDTELLVRSIPQLPEWTCLVLSQDGDSDESPDTKKSGMSTLTSVVKQHGVVLQFEPLAGAVLEKRLIQLAATTGKTLHPGSARYLMNLVDGSTAPALAELQKAILFVDPRSEITERDLDQIVSPSREAKVFALVEAVADGKPEIALTRLLELFQTGSRPEEVALKTLALIARQYRLIWGARALIDSHHSLQNPDKVPKELAQKLPKEPHVLQVLQRQPFLRSRLQRQAERLTRSQLASAFETIRRADLALKGMEPGVNATEIMERLVLQLAIRS